MCFRPVAAQKPVKCPSCGRRVAIVAGYRSPNCPYCKAELPKPEPERIACPRCGAMNDMDAPACHSCGLTVAEATAAMNKPKKCPECGALNPAANDHCQKCNAELPSAF